MEPNYLPCRECFQIYQQLCPVENESQTEAHIINDFVTWKSRECFGDLFGSYEKYPSKMTMDEYLIYKNEYYKQRIDVIPKEKINEFIIEKVQYEYNSAFIKYSCNEMVISEAFKEIHSNSLINFNDFLIAHMIQRSGGKPRNGGWKEFDVEHFNKLKFLIDLGVNVNNFKQPSSISIRGDISGIAQDYNYKTVLDLAFNRGFEDPYLELLITSGSVVLSYIPKIIVKEDVCYIKNDRIQETVNRIMEPIIQRISLLIEIFLKKNEINFGL
jgi:hypothetical protein